jgi:hypothetical protein
LTSLDPEAVIERLSRKVGRLMAENAMLEVALEAAQEALAEAAKGDGDDRTE